MWVVFQGVNDFLQVLLTRAALLSAVGKASGQVLREKDVAQAVFEGLGFHRDDPGVRAEYMQQPEVKGNARRQVQEAMRGILGYRACFDQQAVFGTDDEEIDYYLSLNRYHAVTNPAFTRWMTQSSGARVSSESAKQFAIRDFIEHVIRILSRTGANSLRRPISVGFSDDDVGNVAAVERYIQEELARRFPSVKFCVYDTSDPALADGRKVIVAGQLDFGF